MEANTNETNVETVAAETGAHETGAAEETAKSFTRDEVLLMIQKESDKRVTQALKSQQKKYEKQLSLSRLDDEERAKAEKDERIKELEALLAEKDIANNKSELKSVLGARGLSAEFADIITITEDLEESQANIDKLDKLFKAAVKAEVERRLAGSAPKGNAGSAAREITKESVKTMSIAELDELSRKNPELFEKIFNY